ncbi:rhomboid family intramembrane serine protease [Roseisolibacter agri]|uniref:Rhomboid family intramembrane serine protease n=1 Tax=Roseisolibacter agri TaxID=2014610 RepID=A0AA37V4J5_9BACT|nr:rhomboid family intramembrane serine protease [Roseisolibacter agri]GLC28032.1 rhomboid family intramembrane serine protease [Roseisolibacter agri]
MIPISDDNPTLRTPVVTYLLLAALLVTWVWVQGAGMEGYQLIASVCNWGMVPGELTHRVPVGLGVPMAPDVACVIDEERRNVLTPLTSMFLHGGWAHLLGNAVYLWVFGNNVEDSMGRGRFLAFYLLCGLAAAATHVLLEPTSPVPTVGASGAISGVLGGYLLLYPRVRVRTYFPPIFLFHVPAWLMLILWFGQQVLAGLPQLMQMRPDASGGVAVWAHVGGFVAGVLLVRLFEDPSLVRRRVTAGDARVVFDPNA